MINNSQHKKEVTKHSQLLKDQQLNLQQMVVTEQIINKQPTTLMEMQHPQIILTKELLEIILTQLLVVMQMLLQQEVTVMQLQITTTQQLLIQQTKEPL